MLIRVHLPSPYGSLVEYIKRNKQLFGISGVDGQLWSDPGNI